jgi:hypothetical protein
MDELVKVEEQTEEITTLVASARDYAAQAKSQRTRRIYHQSGKRSRLGQPPRASNRSPVSLGRWPST